MSDLRNVISQLASQFANGVLEAIRGASLEDILLETRKDGGALVRLPAREALAAAPRSVAGAKATKTTRRLERRSEGDIAEVVSKIVALLTANAKGLRAEEIRARLGLDAKELPRPITQALADLKITKVGEKRATTYFAGSGKPVAPPPAKLVASAPPKSTAPSGSRPAPKSNKKTSASTKVDVAAPAQASPRARSASKKAPLAARSAPKTKGASKGAAKAAGPAPKGAPKGKKAAKTPTKSPTRGAAAPKPSPIEEAVTIVTTGVPGDISG